MASSSVHIISKTDNTKHAVCQIPHDASELPPSSVLVRTHLISLSSNNLSYARSGGAPLFWWDAYPAPASCPAPYNNREEWGIVSAWGYATVLDSTIDAITKGSLLWGLWPASGHAVQLQLARSAPAGHWTETSPHRGRLMTVYNHYEQVQQAPAEDEEMKATALFKPLWGGPNLLNRSTFSEQQRIHPLGFGLPWSAADADLSSAVVVSLSASSKTGRGFYWELARNRDVAAHGPLGLMQLTSAPETLPAFDTELPVRSASYADADTAAAVSWVAEKKPKRIVIVDFGASDAVLQTLVASLSEAVAEAAVVVIAVGFENKVYTTEELAARRTAISKQVMLNTSGLRDLAIKAVGPETYYRELDETWERCAKDQTFGNITLKTLRGVEGPEGIEGAWSDLCGRKVPASVGLVVEVSKL